MRIAIPVLALACGGADEPPVTIDRDLDLEPYELNPFVGDEMRLEVEDTSFALSPDFPDHFALVRTEPFGPSCTLGFVIWDDADVEDRGIVEVGHTAIGAPTFRLLGTGATNVELRGTFTRGPEGTCISGLPDEVPVRAEIRVRVFEPAAMVLDKPCWEDQDPVRVAAGTWLPLEGLAIADATGDRYRPANAGPPAEAPFAVEVRTTTGEVPIAEPARDDFWSNLPGIRAPNSPAADVVIEGPGGLSLTWDVVGPADIDADIGFVYVFGDETLDVTAGATLDPRLEAYARPWVVPTVSDATVGGDALCGPTNPDWFVLTASDDYVCPVERFLSAEEVPPEVRAVTEDVLTAASLTDIGSCELTLTPPGTAIAFEVAEP